MRPSIPGGRGWRVLADGLTLIAIGAILPAADYPLIPNVLWESAMILTGLLVVLVAYRPTYGLRAVLSLLVPLVLGARAISLFAADVPALWIASLVWVLLAFHIVAAFAPGEELKP